ncbi:Antifreeze glycopeptide polyprotein [Candidatus Terasakiella magnetica]|nr:Antifreeze glycopeptide polyprotein [Candidatus Terasakiella magnetica]
MTSSHANRLIGVASLAVMVLAVGSAMAQPMPLTPPPAAEEGHAPAAHPVKVLTSPKLQDGPPAEFPTAETALPKGPSGHFEVEELKAPDLEAVGVLDDKQGGLGVGMWRGTQTAVVRRFLPQLPAANGSRVARGLARRLLLTAAAAPDNIRDGGAPLLELRAERLFAMGEIEGLASLLKAAPAALTSPGLARLKMDTYLLAGDTKAACGEFSLIPGSIDTKMQIFCNLVAGKVLEANLALDLMRDRKDADHAFVVAAEAMAGTPPAKIDRLPNITPLHLAAFRAAKMALPADIAQSGHPALLRVMADSPALPLEVRLTAAEKAEMLGAMETDALRRMISAVTFTAAEQQAAANDKGPRGRALVFKTALAEQQPVARVNLIAHALTSAGDPQGFANVARLYAPLISEIKPSPELAPFAVMAARALYAAARPEAAGGWLALAKSDPATAKAADEMWPLTRLTRSGGEEMGSTLLYAALRPASDHAERRSLVALDLLQAVGEKVPAAEWLATLQGPAVAAATTPKPQIKVLQRNAAEALRVGETVLLTLISLGDTGLDKTDPETLNRAVQYLRLAGFDREARELAVEAALANGL